QFFQRVSFMSKRDPSALAAIQPSLATALGSTEGDVFGPPPLIEGEDRAGYATLLARVTTSVSPADVIEEIWVRDVVDLVWDAFRLRRLKVRYLEAAAHEGVRKLLEPLVKERRDLAYFQIATDLSLGWARREPGAVKEVNKQLAAAGLTMDTVMAQTLALNFG